MGVINIIVVSLQIASVSVHAREPLLSQEMVDHINSVQSSWTAHVSHRFAGASFDDIKALCGTRMRHEKIGHSLSDLEELTSTLSLASHMYPDIPTEFDVREAWPQCSSVSGHIRDQSKCGSCWAFASVEAFNDRYCIATNDTSLLSPTDALANSGCYKGQTQGCISQGCDGGHPEVAYLWMKSQGVVTGGDYNDTETCAPYPFPPCAHHVLASPGFPACAGGGDDEEDVYATPAYFQNCTVDTYMETYKTDKRRAGDVYALKGVKFIQLDMLWHGSATAALEVFSDFPTYKSGVYRYTNGTSLGGHAVKLLGWGTEKGEPYWLVANSWNTHWGDNGLFKIRRGVNECGIESNVIAGRPETKVADSGRKLRRAADVVV